MKNLILLFVILFTTNIFGQVAPPQAFNYSAVARDATGKPISNQTIGIQLSILKTSATGTIQYQENHFINTDAFGLFNLTVGTGAIQQGKFESIAWNDGTYYIKVGLDASGGTSFVTMGTTQLLSVPYALHAKTAETLTGNKSVSQHYIGEYFEGGIIFYISRDSNGIEHGLIVSTEELTSNSDGITWGYDGSDISNSESQWDGNKNTNSIIAAGGSGTPALLSSNNTLGGKNDWYLPSVKELGILMQNRHIINYSLSKLTNSDEINQWVYWSSTEADAFDARCFYSGIGSYFQEGKRPKSGNAFVRSIRSF